MSASPFDVVTLPEMASYLVNSGGATSPDGEFIQGLITGASEMAARYCGFQPLGPAAENRHGNGSDCLILRHWPVHSIAALGVNGVPVRARQAFGLAFGMVSTVATYGWTAVPSGYYLEPPRSLYVLGHTFAKGIGNVYIQYTAGFVTAGQAALSSEESLTPDVPAPIVEAVKMIVATWYKEPERAGQVALGVVGAQTTYSQAALPPKAKLLLDLYASVVA